MSSQLQWIEGPACAAVRPRDSHVFSQWPTPPDAGSVPMGLHLALARPDEEWYSDPTATRAVVAMPIQLPRIPLWLAGLLTLLGYALTWQGIANGAALPPASPMHHLDSWLALAQLLLGAAAGYTIAAVWEGGIASARLARASRCFGLGRKGPSVEPVVWRLGLSASSAWCCALGLLGFVGVFAAWGNAVPALASGLAVGVALYGLRITMPFRPGPHTRLLEQVLGVSDYARSLRWSLTAIFPPADQRSAPPQPRVMVAGFASVVLWSSCAIITLQCLAWPGAQEINAPRIAWVSVAVALGLGIALSFMNAVVRLCRYAFLFGGRVERRPIKPAGAAVRSWARNCALTTHVPSIASLPWRWSHASPGNLLVQQGATDRSFHWLASGEARVLLREDAGDVHQLATLRGGAGVGEQAFLDHRPRGTDVVISREALIVSLEYADFDAHVSEADRMRFREVVLAGQAFAHASVFRGCPPAEKEGWLRGGAPRRYEPGEEILLEGGADRWMGLVVRGHVDVLREGKSLATLSVGAVFGEFAFLYGDKRNATLRAEDEVLLWSWSPEWLAEEMARNDLREEFETLAAARSGS